MVELFSRIIFISLEIAFAKIQTGLTSSITSNPSTRSYPFAQDCYSIWCSQGACSRYWTSVICPVPGGKSPRHAVFPCLHQPNLISKLHDSLYIPPLAKVSPPSPAWSRFSEWLCLWEFGVELGGCSGGCKWGMYVCTCRSLSTTCPRTGNLLLAFFAFPLSFFAIAYPRKPAHCQNIRRILF